MNTNTKLSYIQQGFYQDIETTEKENIKFNKLFNTDDPDGFALSEDDIPIIRFVNTLFLFSDKDEILNFKIQNKDNKYANIFLNEECISIIELKFFYFNKKKNDNMLLSK